MKNQLLAQMTLVCAKGKLGEREATGHNDGAFVETIQNFVDGDGSWMRGQPWCAAFASWCMHQAGASLGVTPLAPKSGSSSDLYAWLLAKGFALAIPQANCLGFVRGDGGTLGKTHHHTFLVESVSGDRVISIDGNWKNSVAKTSHAVGDCDFAEIV